MIKRQGALRTMEFCLSNNVNNWWSKEVDKRNLGAFLEQVGPFLNRTDLQIRTERSSFNIFCSDPNLFKQLCNAVGYWTVEIHEPASEQEREFMVDNNAKKVLCKELPHGLYSYKVYLKTSIPVSIRESFLKWHNNYEGKILIPKQVSKWLNSKGAWTSSPYIYVANSSTLSMVGLFLGNGVLRVEEFIPRSSINTSIDQEQPCPL